MQLSDIAKFRLLNQQIASTRCKTPRDVVATLGAIQAQDYPNALWAIGLRIPDGINAAITRAIEERTIVRTWPMRGTLHFVAAEDVRWMLELLTPRVIASNTRRYLELELSDSVFARSRELFIDRLQGGRFLPRDEMYALLESSGISTIQQRGYHILSRLAQDGVLCFGVHAGKQPTFTLLEEWVPNSQRLDSDSALARLAWQYFAGHGPATLKDFAWWSGLKLSEAKAALEMVASKLDHETVSGSTYWMSHERPDLRCLLPTSHLLPGFDEFLLGYTDRSATLEPIHAAKVMPGKNGMFMSTIVRDGQVVGIWKRVLTKKAVVITAIPFTPFTKTECREFEVSAQVYGRFLGRPIEFIRE